ncbi:MAG: carboxypeptidase-like regulatory domain-containing protein [Bacteroidota bacterium]|nr:carboxypeptidase-like regulatory domain-containing protein [Bacteroidota bacterium]
MKKVITILFIFIFTGALFATGPADDVMFVSGTVVDKQNHETLAGVEVHVKGTSIVTYTDFDGNFFIPGLPSGSYQLEFHYIAYTSSLLVKDNCDHCTTVSVELEQR